MRNQTVIRGKAVGPDGKPLQKPIITVTDDDDNVTGIYTPDPNTNNFLMILPRGKKFKVSFESSNYSNFDYFISVPEYSYDESKSVVTLNDIVTKESQQILASGKQELQNRQNKNIESSAESQNSDAKGQTEIEKTSVKEQTSQEVLANKETKSPEQLNAEQVDKTEENKALPEQPSQESKNVTAKGSEDGKGRTHNEGI